MGSTEGRVCIDKTNPLMDVNDSKCHLKYGFWFKIGKSVHIIREWNIYFNPPPYASILCAVPNWEEMFFSFTLGELKYNPSSPVRLPFSSTSALFVPILPSSLNIFHPLPPPLCSSSPTLPSAVSASLRPARDIHRAVWAGSCHSESHVIEPGLVSSQDSKQQSLHGPTIH